MPRIVDAHEHQRRTGNGAQSTGKLVQWTARLHQMLLASRRHGPLTAKLLFEFHRGSSTGHYGYFQKVLTDFVHERAGGGPFLIRPGELNPRGSMQPRWYAISEQGIAALSDEQTDLKYPIPRRDDWHHRAMGAAITASFELLAPRYGMTFYDAQYILDHEKCPNSTKHSSNPLLIEIPGECDDEEDAYLEPDGLIGLRYPNGRLAFFALEYDRATESLEAAARKPNSIREKLQKYEQVLERELYRDRWGISALRVLFITTAPGRIANLHQLASKLPHGNYFYFTALPQFGRRHWKAPVAPVEEIFTPWSRVSGSIDISRA